VFLAKLENCYKVECKDVTPFSLWSMLDTALMIQSIGVTALVVVLEEAKHRRLAFRVAIVLYLLAVLDMGINVCISGVVGWKS